MITNRTVRGKFFRYRKDLLFKEGIDRIATMPVIKSAAKALKQARKRTLQNKSKVSNLKAEVKKFKKQKNPQSLAKIYSLVDKMAKTHVIHKNKSKRLKSRFALMVAKNPSPKKKTS